MNMFGTDDCSMHVRDHRSHLHHHIKSEPRDCSTHHHSVMSTMASTKLSSHPSSENGGVNIFAGRNGSLTGNGGGGVSDNRMVWAALTPRGTTQHFVSENYPRDMVGDEDHYESIDNVQPVLINAGYGTYSPYRKGEY